MSVNSITAALTPSTVSVRSGSQFELGFDLTNTNIKQDPFVVTAEAAYTDESGANQIAAAQSEPINVDRSVLTNVLKITLPAGIMYVAGSARWNGVPADATLVAGVLTAVVNEPLPERGVGKFTATFAL